MRRRTGGQGPSADQGLGWKAERTGLADGLGCRMSGSRMPFRFELEQLAECRGGEHWSKSRFGARNQRPIHFCSFFLLYYFFIFLIFNFLFSLVNRVCY